MTYIVNSPEAVFLADDGHPDALGRRVEPGCLVSDAAAEHEGNGALVEAGLLVHLDDER